MTIISTGPADKGNTPGIALKSISDDYVAQMQSIIDINRTVIPEMTKREDAETRSVRDRILSQLSPTERAASRDYLNQIGRSLIATDGPKDGTSRPTVTIEVQDRAVGSAVTHLILELSSRAKAGPRGELLRKSLLVTAVSAFEVLFGQVARSIYGVNSASLNDSEYAFTLQELAKFPSLDDAREYLIEKKISALLRDSVDGWNKWLQRASGGVSMDSLPVYWPIIRESFARRNLIVHAGGVVNQLYLSVVKTLDLEGEVKIPPGAQIDVNEEYLDWVLQELLALGQILVFAVGKKLHRKEDALFTSLALNATQNHSKKRAWHASKALCEYTLSCRLSRKDEMSTRVRYWLSKKESEGLEEIRSEIEEWDTSGLDARISHCKPVLLDDVDSVIPEIMGLISQGHLSRFELNIDPLYDAVAQRLTASQQEQESGDEQDDD